MAFSLSKLSAVGYADGVTHWQYKNTSDTLATIMADGYFDTAAHMMRQHDPIRIIASDGVWEDVVESVVTTSGSEDVAIGVQFGTVVDSTGTNTHKLGLRRHRWDGAEFVRLVADASCAAMDVVIIESDSGAQPLTATNGADSVGVGKDLAVVAETLSQAIATGDFFWGCIKAPASAGIKVNMVASVEAHSALYAVSTAGHLTDVAAAGLAVFGIVSTEEDDVEAVSVINYPRVNVDLII